MARSSAQEQAILQATPPPRAVTVPVFQSIAAGLAACAVLARSVNASLELVDVGVNVPAGPVPLPQRDGRVRVTHRRVCNGTRDMTLRAAMSGDEMREAMAAGAAALRCAEAAGCSVVCVGEIGIGNTTAAAALLSALTGAVDALLRSMRCCLRSRVCGASCAVRCVPGRRSPRR